MAVEFTHGLREIPLQDRKAKVDLDSEQLLSTKTLGVWWLAEQDVFTFAEMHHPTI